MSSFTLSLQHTSDTVDPNETLPRLIERINQQIGFRNISESTLLEEIRAAEASQVKDEPEEDAPSGAQDETARLEEIYGTREELRNFIAQAHNDALTALDFVSLLLSKDRPLQGGMTMSPALKQMVPAGSLGFMKFDPPAPSEQDRRVQQDISTGWTLDSLDSAADKLLSSAMRLEETIEKETTYWEQVMSISAQGWSLLQMPGEQHTIGVQFGFTEAASAFQARNMAALRPNTAGEIILDQSLATEPKVVRVQVLDDNRVTATSRPSEPPPTGEVEIETQIRRARDALFEEEVFYEMTREARTLLPYNVRVRDNAIILPLNTTTFSSASKSDASDRLLSIDLVPLHHTPSCKTTTAQNNEGNNLAALASLSLRLLLCHAYRLKFARRTTPPPPLPAEPQPPPALPILRPLLTHLHHASALTALYQALQALQRKRTGDPSAAAQISVTSADNTNASSATGKQDMALEREITTATSTVTVSFPPPSESTISELSTSTDTSMTIEARTSLNSPIYGTSFTVTSTSTSTSTDHPVNASEAKEAMFTRTEDLLSHIATFLPSSKVSNSTNVNVGQEASGQGVEATADEEKGKQKEGTKEGTEEEGGGSKDGAVVDGVDADIAMESAT